MKLVQFDGPEGPVAFNAGAVLAVLPPDRSKGAPLLGACVVVLGNGLAIPIRTTVPAVLKRIEEAEMGIGASS